MDKQVVGLQILSFLIKKYEYQIVRISNINTKDFWLINPKANYPLICITDNLYTDVSVKQSIFGQIYIAIIKTLNQNKKCLIINTNNKCQKFQVDDILQIPVLDHQPLDDIILNEFKGIEESVKEVKNANKEKRSIVRSLNRMNGKSHPVTSIISLICIIMFFAIQLLTNISHNEITSSIVLGSYYKINVVGAYEYWRLLTSGFLHISAVHLLANLISLKYIGGVIESKLSKTEYIITLLVSIFVGNIFVLIGESNIVGVGISGGIYGFLGVYSVLLYTSGAYKNQQAMRSFMSVLLVNLCISMLPNISGLAHLGGYISGVVCGIFFSKSKLLSGIKKHVMVSFVALLIGCCTFVPGITRISPIYGGTDAMIIYTLKELHLDGYADYLLNRYDAHLSSQGEKNYKLFINELVEGIKEEYNEKN